MIVFPVKIKCPNRNRLTFFFFFLITCTRVWQGRIKYDHVYYFINQILNDWISSKSSICQQDCVNTTYPRISPWRNFAQTNIVILFFTVRALVYSVITHSIIDNETKYFIGHDEIDKSILVIITLSHVGPFGKVLLTKCHFNYMPYRLYTLCCIVTQLMIALVQLN